MVQTVGNVILPAGGAASAAIGVSLVEDSIAEFSEFFLMEISVVNDEGEVVPGLQVANITILDNDRMLIWLHKDISLILHTH